MDEYLKGIFGSNEKYEFAKKMRDQFQKAVCRHPLEWDKTLFNCKKIEDSYFDITHTHLREHIKTKLIKESEQSDIWEGALQNVFKKNDFYFVNPLYFAHHLDRAEVFGFNPYEGKTYRELYSDTDAAPNINMSEVVKDNPGFAPYSGEKNIIGGYTKITGFFNQDYKKYYQEGLDFGGQNGITPIKALVNGKVVMLKNQKNDHYGLSTLVQGTNMEDGKHMFYLLGHLARYAESIEKGVNVYPGMIVGYVGNSGNCYTNGHKINEAERKAGKGAHLHLSVYKTDKKAPEIYGSKNFITKYIENGKEKSDLVNPFDHREQRRHDKN